GVAWQQWMCAAVLPLVRPLKTTLTRMVWAVGSIITIAVPVPAEPVGGTSLLPRRLAMKALGAAWLAGMNPIRAAKHPDRSASFLIRGDMDVRMCDSLLSHAAERADLAPGRRYFSNGVIEPLNVLQI